MKKIYPHLLLIIIFLTGCMDRNSNKNSQEKNAPQYVMEVCGEGKINNPNYKNISNSLTKVLDGSCKDDSFLIISHFKDENTYVQIAYSVEMNDFVVEYQDGSIDKHFQSTRNLNSAEVLNILVEYSLSSKQWDQNILWQRIKV
jgi:hypothetical protein